MGQELLLTQSALPEIRQTAMHRTADRILGNIQFGPERTGYEITIRTLCRDERAQTLRQGLYPVYVGIETTDLVLRIQEEYRIPLPHPHLRGPYPEGLGHFFTDLVWMRGYPREVQNVHVPLTVYGEMSAHGIEVHVCSPGFYLVHYHV